MSGGVSGANWDGGEFGGERGQNSPPPCPEGELGGERGYTIPLGLVGGDVGMLIGAVDEKGLSVGAKEKGLLVGSKENEDAVDCGNANGLVVVWKENRDG